MGGEPAGRGKGGDEIFVIDAAKLHLGSPSILMLPFW